MLVCFCTSWTVQNIRCSVLHVSAVGYWIASLEKHFYKFTMATHFQMEVFSLSNRLLTPYMNVLSTQKVHGRFPPQITQWGRIRDILVFSKVCHPHYIMICKTFLSLWWRLSECPSLYKDNVIISYGIPATSGTIVKVPANYKILESICTRDTLTGGNKWYRQLVLPWICS